ncbi:MAG: TRAP transporter fused permease subunit [Actinobacteria bacterium]|nr:TRAP transporter fused permease subunit [Actinomycetota bacterium]
MKLSIFYRAILDKVKGKNAASVCVDKKSVDEKNVRELRGRQMQLVLIVGALLSIFVFLSNVFLIMPLGKTVIIFLGFLLFIVFLLFPGSKTSSKDSFSILDLLLSFTGVLCSAYAMMRFSVYFSGKILTPTMWDYLFSVLTIFLLIEATRRIYGLIIPIIVVFSLVYLLFGPYFPGFFSHGGFSLKRVLLRMFMTDVGIFGLLIHVAFNFILLFMLFGELLNVSGGSYFFNDLAQCLVGGRRGGAAQVSVVSSGIMGTMSGCAIANVTTTGTFTIPLMKKIGYSPAFAAGVEAAASSGGMLMPPIMGTGALLMSGLLSIPYKYIIIAAFIPALLYYFSIFMAVDFRARKAGLKGADKSSLPKITNVFKERGHLIIPIFLLILLLMSGYSPSFAAVLSLIAITLVSSLKANTRMTIKIFFNAIAKGALSAIPICIVCTVIGIVVETISMTGVGAVIGASILQLGQGNSFLTAFLVMLVTLIASLGLPAGACYIIVDLYSSPIFNWSRCQSFSSSFFCFLV